MSSPPTKTPRAPDWGEGLASPGDSGKSRRDITRKGGRESSGQFELEFSATRDMVFLEVQEEQSIPMRDFDERTMAVLRRIREDSLREDAVEAYPGGRRLHAIPFDSGWFLYALVRALSASTVQAFKPFRALELGMSAGMSTIFIARALKDSYQLPVPSGQGEEGERSPVACVQSPEPIGRLYTMEYDQRKLALGRRNLEEVGLSEWVEIIEGDAKQNVKSLEGTFEFVFNDAEKVDYIYFIKELERVTRVGSVVVSDNAISHREMLGDFFAYLADSPKWLSQTIPIGNGLEMSVRVG